MGVKDSVAVQSGQTFPSGAFRARGASSAIGVHGPLRPAPSATDCWPEAPWGAGILRPRTRGFAPPPPPPT